MSLPPARRPSQSTGAEYTPTPDTSPDIDDGFWDTPTPQAHASQPSDHTPPAVHADPAPTPITPTPPVLIGGNDAIAPNGDNDSTNTPPRRARRNTRSPQPGATHTRSRRLTRARGTITVALLFTATLSGIGYGIWTAANPPASAQEVAQIVIGSIASDGTYTALEDAGATFLAAYLTTSSEASDTNKEIINTLTAGEGNRWRTLPPAGDEGPIEQRVIGTPSLVFPLAASDATPGAVTGVYRVYLDTGDGPAIDNYSVTMTTDELGLVTISAPPAVLPVPNAEPELPEPVIEAIETSRAAAPNIQEFLKVWTQMGPDADPSTATQLSAWLAPDANQFAQLGLNGRYRLVSVDDVTLTGTGPYTGTVTAHLADPQGRSLAQKYAITVTLIDGKYLIQGIGPA